MITEMNSAINMMEPFPAPAHMMIIGPSATFGKLFKMVRYGSNTFAKNGNHHNIVAIRNPRKVPSKKLMIVSYVVTHT